LCFLWTIPERNIVAFARCDRHCSPDLGDSYK
jgi:hypothetical protein